MKEEKFDRIVRKVLNEQFMQEPSRYFTDKVMQGLGVKPAPVPLKTKPLNSKWGLLLMGVLYLLILVSVMFLPGTLESSAFRLPAFNLSALSEYLNLSDNLSKMLILLILGGWILLFSDRYIRRFFMRQP